MKPDSWPLLPQNQALNPLMERTSTPRKARKIESHRERLDIAVIYTKRKNKQSFGPNTLELLGLMDEVVSVSLGHDPTLVGFLDKIFVSLLLGEQDRILLALKVQIRSLHAVGRGLPTHQWVLPAVAFL